MEPDLILPALWHRWVRSESSSVLIDADTPNPFVRHRTDREGMSRSVGSPGACPEPPPLCVFTAGLQVWYVKAPAN